MAIYLYCFGHQLNLVVQDSLKSIPEVPLALVRMSAVVHFMRNSQKLDKFKDRVAHEDLTRLVRFYDGDVHLDNLRFERNIWFERCR